ncbi:MAG TPA: AtpZ/AtpI family protein [Gemmatimonadaceae bacterium]
MTDPQGNRTGVTGGEAAGLGVQFAGILVAFTFLGLWIDRHLETSPWFLIVMVFGGAAAGFYSMYRKLMKGQRLGDRRTHNDRRDETK